MLALLPTVAAVSLPAAAPPESLLQAIGISKLFPGTVALDRVDFNVYRGKVNVLIGENGAGKSTLMKILAGVYSPTEGQMLLEGQPVEFRSPTTRHAGGSASSTRK